MLPALVLGAGLGTRLDPLTRLVAKPAVPLAGRPLIVHLLAWLRREGVRDVVINLHHRPDSVTAAVGDGAHLGLRVRYSWEQPVLGSAGGPRHALPLLDRDQFLIVNGDTLHDFALAPLVSAHDTAAAEVTLAVVPNPAPSSYNGAVVEHGRVVGFRPRGDADGTAHFIGVQVVRAAVFAGLPDGVPIETVSGIYRERLAAGWTGLRAWDAPSAGLDIGTPADYLSAALARAGGHAAVAADAAVAPSARVAGSVIWPGVRVGEGAALEACIAATDIPPGFQAARASLVDAALVAPDEGVPCRDGVAVFPFAHR